MGPGSYTQIIKSPWNNSGKGLKRVLEKRSMLHIDVIKNIFHHSASVTCVRTEGLLYLYDLLQMLSTMGLQSQMQQKFSLTLLFHGLRMHVFAI